MTACPVNPVPSAESGLPSGQPSHGQEPAACLIPLLQALSEQTAAILRLAQSNEMLVQAMAEGDEQDPDAEPRTYMDGSPVR
jgi:hypothetical protein